MKSDELMIKERTINGLKADIQRLEIENAHLKQNERAVKEAKLKYQSVIAEANEIKKKYTVALTELESMKRAYKKKWIN